MTLIAPSPDLEQSAATPAHDVAHEATTGRRLRILAISAVYLPLWALVCNFVLEISVWWGMGGPSWYEMFVHGYGYWLGALVVWLCLATLVVVTNRMWLSMGVVLTLALTLAAVNRVKLGIRSEPLYPSDLEFLRQPRFLAEMVAPGWLLAGAFAAAAVVAAFVLVGRRLDRPFPRITRQQAPRWWWSLLAVRLVCAALGLALLSSTLHFNEPGNRWRELYEAKGADWRFWYQRLNYRDNGFVGGALYNMPTPAMQQPSGYSEARMEDITAQYSAIAARVNRDRTPGALDDVNVVMVLNEAFSDPAQLAGFELGEDPLARTRETMASSASGTMLAQLYGGGTANMEFEALTSQSLALFEPQMNTPYQMLVPEYSHYPSAVEWFEQNGHEPIAVHPYFTGMYKRNQVYDVLGFEKFVHDTTMRSDERLDDTEFISDRAAFDEVVHQIEESTSPVFMNLVTMQNHVPAEGWEDPIEVTGIEEDAQSERIGQYARGLAETDEALAHLLRQLELSDERTVMVFYGDHQPGIYDDDLESKQDDLALYKTPFFIWDSAGQVPRELPITSPIHFLPLLFDVVAAPVTPYFALLDQVRKRIPAMEQGRYLTPEGEARTLEELPAVDRALLDDLRMVQYDLSVGERYSADAMWPSH